MTNDNCFICDTCGVEFHSPLYDISKEFEQSIFFAEPRMPEVEVVNAESLAVFCSQGCRDEKREQILQQANVRATYPDIGPTEVCSRCGGPVDMANYHLTYVEMALDFGSDPSKFGADVLNAQVLAVVCQKCAPIDTVKAEAIAKVQVEALELMEAISNRGNSHASDYRKEHDDAKIY